LCIQPTLNDTRRLEMMKNTIQIIFLCLFIGSTHFLSASSWPCTGCDTLFTTSGQRLIVRNLHAEDGYWKYELCNSSQATPRRMLQSKVKEVRFAIPDVPEIVPNAVPAITNGQPSNEKSATTTQSKPPKHPPSTKPVEAVNRMAKYAALGSFGGFMMVLAAYHILPLLAILALTGLIYGIVMGLKTMKNARCRPELRKAYRLSRWAFWLPMIVLGLNMLSVVISPIILLIIILFAI
jgi:hypothetical protein